MDKTLKAELEWVSGEDTGISSMAIWRAMLGLPRGRVCTPSDPSDFGRCYRLFQAIPHWKHRISELGSLLQYAPTVNGVKRPNLWKVLADHWSEFSELYEQEHPTGNAPKLYKHMKELGF